MGLASGARGSAQLVAAAFGQLHRCAAWHCQIPSQRDSELVPLRNQDDRFDEAPERLRRQTRLLALQRGGPVVPPWTGSGRPCSSAAEAAAVLTPFDEVVFGRTSVKPPTPHAESPRLTSPPSPDGNELDGLGRRHVTHARCRRTPAVSSPAAELYCAAIARTSSHGAPRPPADSVRGCRASPERPP